MRYLRDSMN